MKVLITNEISLNVTKLLYSHTKSYYLLTCQSKIVDVTQKISKLYKRNY